MRRNPCELAIDLFCHGVAIDPSCDLAADGRGLCRTRAGLGSGLDLVLAGAPPLGHEVWINVPIEEQFVAGSPFVLRHGDRYEVVDQRHGQHYAVRLPPEPGWYRRETADGTPMHRIGVLQGTYLGIYVGATCRFWHASSRQQCHFCTTGLNTPADVPRSVRNVVEVARAAKEESGVTFVHLNTGYQNGGAYRLMAPFVEALKREVGVLVGVQAAPEGTRAELDRLVDMGVDHFSWCFEYFDPEFFRVHCPGKQEKFGQKAFFDALAHVQSRMPRGSCSGEIIAGNEATARTLEAIEFITGLGAFPTVCIFRPLAGSDMETWPAPRYEDMRRVMRHVWECCRDRAIPIGLAPNLEVSLVIQPTDTAYLSDFRWRDRWYLAKNRLRKRLASPLFRSRMRPRGPRTAPAHAR